MLNWPRLAASVDKSTAERAVDCVQEAKPIDQWTWELTTPQGKVYKAGLFESADGWHGMCECTAFRMNQNRTKDGAPVKPCKHLVWLKRYHAGIEEHSLKLGAPDTSEEPAVETKTEEKGGEPPSGGPAASRKAPPPAPVEGAGVSGLPIEADPEAAFRAMQQFEAVKRRIVGKEDVVKSKGKEYIRRSGFRKIALAYRISTQLLERRWERAGNEVIAYAAYRAIAPNGRYADGEGWCSLSEANVKKLSSQPGMAGKQYHVAAAIAATRAINRAIADLIGGGQVSAEEVDAEFYVEG